MRRFIEKRLKVYTSEQSGFIWLMIVFFTIFLVTAIFRNYTDTAFLKRYGPENIPLMLVINGVVTFIVFGITGRLGRRFLDHILLSWLLVFYALSTGGVFFMVKAGNELAYPILFQLLYLLDSIQLLYLWNIAGDLFDARQGKRIFPLVTAAQVLATSLGNFITKPVTSLAGQDFSLLIFASTCFALAVFLIRTGGKLLTKAEVKGPKSKIPTKKFTEIPRLMAEFPIIRFLVVLGFVPSLVMPIFNYQFNVIANSTFVTEGALISFLGVFRGAMTLVTFLALFVVGRLYSRLGLANSSLVNPINFVLLFSLLSFYFNIYVAATGQFFSRLAQRAVHGPVTKILYSVIPGDLVTWSRSFIRGTVVKAGMMAGALLMIALKPVIDVQFLAPIAGLISLYWLVEAILFGRHYHRSLKQVIMERRIDFDQIEAVRAMDPEGHAHRPGGVTVEDRQEEALVEVDCKYIDPELALAQLSDRNDVVRAEAAASFACTQDPRAVKRLVELLDDEEVVRKAAIDALMTYQEAILPYLETSLVHAPVRVRRGILEVIRLSGSQGFEVGPFVAQEINDAFTNLIAYNRLTSEDKDILGVRMLSTHLQEKNNEVLSLIFHALWVHHPDMRLMYEALNSKEASVAVEMVEATLDRSLTSHLIPLIEEIPLKEKIAQGRRALPLIRDNGLERILTILADREDPTTRMLALLAIGQLFADQVYFLPIVEKSRDNPDPYVRQVAEYAFRRCLNEDPPMPDIIQTINLLKTFSIFDEMGIRELQAIASIATRETFASGDILIKEGEEAGTIYLITGGKLGVYTGHGTEKEVRKAVLGEGAFIGELSLFTRHPPNASCVAIEPLEAFVIRHHQFQEIMKIYPQIGINLCRFLAAKLRGVTY